MPRRLAAGLCCPDPTGPCVWEANDLAAPATDRPMPASTPPRQRLLALGWLALPACTDLEQALDGVLHDLETLETVQTADPTPAVPPTAVPSAPRLPALADQTFATHPFTVPWVHPPLEVTLFLPPTSTRGPELAVGFERSLRGLVERWPGTPCLPAAAIDVYFVAPHLIEDRQRFDLGPNQPDGELWGVYFPWGGAPEAVAIVLRDLDAARIATVLGHELAHHWHHRLCMDGSSEAFAQAYEALDWPHAVSRGGPQAPAAPRRQTAAFWPASVGGAVPPPAQPLSKKGRRQKRRADRRARRRR